MEHGPIYKESKEMRMIATIIFMLFWAAIATAGEYVTVTKNADGSYTVTPTTRGRVVFAEMERVEGQNSLELNTHNLLRGWEGRVKKEMREAAVEELRKSGGVVTPEVQELLKKLK